MTSAQKEMLQDAYREHLNKRNTKRVMPPSMVSYLVLYLALLAVQLLRCQKWSVVPPTLAACYSSYISYYQQSILTRSGFLCKIILLELKLSCVFHLLWL